MLLPKASTWMLSATTTGNSMSIQLQPQSADLEQWVILAQQEAASFEVMDPFFSERYRRLWQA